jgi:hypothetical protein
MKLEFLLIVVLTMVHLPIAAMAIESGIISDVGTSVQRFGSSQDDRFSLETTLTENSLGASLSGKGNFSDSHLIRNKAGDSVSIGANVTHSKRYNYHYCLKPSDTKIAAAEALDIDNATGISAYAEAKSNDRRVAGVNVSITDGSLKGYHNYASVSNGSLTAWQDFSEAMGSQISANAWSSGKSSRENSGKSLGQNATLYSNTTMGFGNVSGYSGLATSNGNLTTGHSISSGKGKYFKANSTVKTIKGNTTNASVTTNVSITGNISFDDYSNIAAIYDRNVTHRYKRNVTSTDSIKNTTYVEEGNVTYSYKGNITAGQGFASVKGDKFESKSEASTGRGVSRSNASVMNNASLRNYYNGASIYDGPVTYTDKSPGRKTKIVPERTVIVNRSKIINGSISDPFINITTINGSISVIIPGHSINITPYDGRKTEEIIYGSFYEGNITAGQSASRIYGDEIKVGATSLSGSQISGVNTTVNFGNISNYSDQARTGIGSQKGDVDQSGSIDLGSGKIEGGRIILRSYYSDPSKGKSNETTRTPNYGTKYSFGMNSSYGLKTREWVEEVLCPDGYMGYAIDVKHITDPFATGGWVGYYVNKSDKTYQSDRIQGAINDANAGDAIFVSADTYNETLEIDKSLAVSGSKKGDKVTTVDGGKMGRVVTVTNKAGQVYLGRLNLTNGTVGTDGGGVYNGGELLVLDRVNISNCQAVALGGGTFNAKNSQLVLRNSSIEGCTADRGGGLYNGEGAVYIDGGYISKNRAKYGGSIYNDVGQIHLERGKISENYAGDGGGIYNVYEKSIFSDKFVSVSKSASITGNRNIVKDNKDGMGGPHISEDDYGEICEIDTKDISDHITAGSKVGIVLDAVGIASILLEPIGGVAAVAAAERSAVQATGRIAADQAARIATQRAGVAGRAEKIEAAGIASRGASATRATGRIAADQAARIATQRATGRIAADQAARIATQRATGRIVADQAARIAAERAGVAGRAEKIEAAGIASRGASATRATGRIAADQAARIATQRAGVAGRAEKIEAAGIASRGASATRVKVADAVRKYVGAPINLDLDSPQVWGSTQTWVTPNGRKVKALKMERGWLRNWQKSPDMWAMDSVNMLGKSSGVSEYTSIYKKQVTWLRSYEMYKNPRWSEFYAARWTYADMSSRRAMPHWWTYKPDGSQIFTEYSPTTIGFVRL